MDEMNWNVERLVMKETNAELKETGKKGGQNGKNVQEGKGSLLTLAQVIFAGEGAKIPLKIDRPGFTRIMVDLQEELRRPIVAAAREVKLGIVSISY